MPDADAPTPVPAETEPPRRVVRLHRQPDGTFVDWGRHAHTGGVRGEGGARWYQGEAARVMALVLEHSGAAPDERETRPTRAAPAVNCRVLPEQRR